jgi:predicted nucleic acid-binding protein
MPGSFFDTNVLLYIASHDAAKANRATGLIGEGGVISVQVLNEIADAARRKMRLSWMETGEFLTTLRGLLTVRPITVEIHETGIDLAERYGLSTYDAMIAASALDAGCNILWSEDMRSGAILSRRLRIVNPFIPAVPKSGP